MTETEEKYDHGGRRKGSGRKSVWASKPSRDETKLARIPTTIFDDVLAIAHLIDAGDLDLKQIEATKKRGGIYLSKAKIKQLNQLADEALTLKANAGGKIKNKVREMKKIWD